MSGSGVKKRARLRAIYAYNLRQDGRTNREIADIIEKPVESIPRLISLGERFHEEQEQPKRWRE